MTVAVIIGAVSVIFGVWIVAFEINRVGNALCQIQADLHDIRCSIYTVGEPANTLLKAQVERQAAARRSKNTMMGPEWVPEIHDGPDCFPD